MNLSKFNKDVCDMGFVLRRTIELLILLLYIFIPKHRVITYIFDFTISLLSTFRLCDVIVYLLARYKSFKGRKKGLNAMEVYDSFMINNLGTLETGTALEFSWFLYIPALIFIALLCPSFVIHIPYMISLFLLILIEMFSTFKFAKYYYGLYSMFKDIHDGTV